VLTALFLVLVVQANSAQPISIEALQFEMLLAERKAVYTGDVEATQGDYTINADELVVFFDEDNKITVMQATGTPAALTDQITQPSLLITGDELDYLFVESIVRANGNGILKQGEDFVRAETIVYDLDAQSARATGGGDERVRVTLAPKPR
jgi:lipopolysaccharide export system protein LptA